MLTSSCVCGLDGDLLIMEWLFLGSKTIQFYMCSPETDFTWCNEVVLVFMRNIFTRCKYEA
jgi:hypothetical protein